MSPSRTWRGVGQTTSGAQATSRDRQPPDPIDPDANPGTPSGRPGEARRHVDYRLDPAPVWGGDLPEKNFKEYHRNLQLWLVEVEARLPHNLIGKRIIDSIPLGSKLSTLLAHLTVEEITDPEGHKHIVEIIEDAHAYLKDQRLEQAFDEAIFRGRRDRGQSMTAFLAAKKAAFAELRKQGLDLLATTAGRHLLGHLLLRQGAFTMDQRQRLKVVTNGSIDYQDIERAIQKVFGDKLDDGLVADQSGRKWRNASFWEEDDEGFEGDFETYAEGDMLEEETDIFSDFVCLSEYDEVQMIFAQDLPMVMDEAEAFEVIGGNFENIFYESRERLTKGKGKGKGKKGKGKSSGKTFGFGSGRGGYLEHRRQLQASRNGRGYDQPWQQRQGSKLSLTELKARTRCHQCKQVGHWSRECPQRGKTNSRGSASTASTPMSTGFFVEPPQAVATSGHQFFTKTPTPASEQYVQCSFVGLSYVFLGMQKATGTALVDTAAQHGLVGIETLEAYDKLLQQEFGLKVQWTTEAGGSVRGVCGTEESTKLAYVPVGLGGKSGVLRVQVVPGEIPFLLPAYFLTELEAVIDMKHATIMYMALGVKQSMTRLSTGHVSVSIVEFGDGFRVPSDFYGTRSQAWTTEEVPDWPALLDTNAHQSSSAAMVPVAALVAAALHLSFPSRVAGPFGGGSYATASRGPSASAEAGAFGEADLRVAAERAESHCRCSSDQFLGDTKWLPQHVQAGGSSTAIGVHQGTREVLGSSTRTFTAMPAQGDDAWSQPLDELSEVQGVQATAADAFGPRERPAALESAVGVPPEPVSEAPPQAGSHWPEQGEGQVHHTSSGGGVHRRRGHGDELRHHGTDAGLPTVPRWTGDALPVDDDRTASLELRQSALREGLPGRSSPTGASTWDDSLSRMSSLGVGADHGTTRADGRVAVPERQLSLSAGLDGAEPGLRESGQVQRRGPRLGFWMSCGSYAADGGLIRDGSFKQIVEALGVEPGVTYVAIGYGDRVKGTSPVTTNPVIDRRVVLTCPDGGHWCAVDVTHVPGNDYQFGASVDYAVLYEFSVDFMDYMLDAEFENEVTLGRSVKAELEKSLDSVLGDQSAYWTLWERSSDPDDVVEIYGQLGNGQLDDVVEVYSPPRVVPAAASRGLQASLSIDLDTGYDLSQARVREEVRREICHRRPRLLISSPPCAKFSQLQNLRADQDAHQQELVQAREHMSFAMSLLEDQLARGGHGLHEHPDTATSWQLKEVQAYLEHDEVMLVKSHLCRFGLRVRGEVRPQSTLFATTCDAIAVNLQKLCKCPTLYEPLISGQPGLAQVYPPELVSAILDGLLQDWVDQQQGKPSWLPDHGDLSQWQDELGNQRQQWREFHGAAVLVARGLAQIPTRGPGHRSVRWTWVVNPVDGKWLQFERGRSGKANLFEVKYDTVIVLYWHPEISVTLAEVEATQVTNAEKNMVLRAHINLGHPGVKEFVRLLKAAGTRNDIINYVLREFACEGCLKEQRQPTRLPAATPRTYDFNVVIGVDVLFVYGHSPENEHPVLNVTCVGTLYSTFTLIDAKKRSSQLVWKAFLRSWLRVFGSPSFVIMDQGLEFQGEFIEGLESQGFNPFSLTETRHIRMVSQSAAEACSRRSITRRESCDNRQILQR